MPDNNSALDRLIDEAAIRDLTARFGDIMMRADYDAFTPLWTDDAVWILGGTEAQPYERRANGIGEIDALFRNLWEGNDFFVHFAVQGPILIEGDEATATCVCHEAARGPERFYRTHGIWTDHLRRTDTGWVFSSRSYHYLWLDFTPFTGDTFPSHPTA